MKGYINQELNTVTYIVCDVSDAYIRLRQVVNDDLFKMIEPIIGTYNHVEPEIVAGKNRFPTIEDLFRAADLFGISAAERIMAEYKVTEEQLKEIGIDIN